VEFRIADTFTDSLGRLTADEQKAVKTCHVADTSLRRPFLFDGPSWPLRVATPGPAQTLPENR
jgi:hypothetical protein